MPPNSDGSYNRLLIYLEPCSEKIFKLKDGDVLINKEGDTKSKTTNVTSDLEKTYHENNIMLLSVLVLM